MQRTIVIILILLSMQTIWNINRASYNTQIVVHRNIKFGVDASVLVDIIDCESKGKINAIGDKGKSNSLVQFQKPTFYELRAKSHMRYLEWKNPIHHLRLFIWALENGYGNKWSCYRKMYP